MKTDILVVGGGPAGATLARRLALAGRDVTVIDKAIFPRHKSCGGGLSRHTIDLLQLDLSPVIESEVDSLMVDGAWTGRVGLPVHQQCQVVKRCDFDTFLLQQAADKGAQVLQGQGLSSITRSPHGFEIVTSQNNTIAARAVCACDGAFSPTAKALNFPRNQQTSVALEAVADFSADHAQGEQAAIFDFTALPKGYAWIFPRKTSAAIGVCSAKKMRATELRAYFDRLICRNQSLQGCHIHSIRGGQIPVFRHPRDYYVQDNAYLVGDAAGLVDMFSGEGLQYAVKSAILAAEAIVGEGAAQYEAELRQQIVPELQLAAQWAHLVFSLPPWLFGAMMSTPVYRYYLRYFTDIFSGVMTYQHMQREAKGVATLLKYLG